MAEKNSIKAPFVGAIVIANFQGDKYPAIVCGVEGNTIRAHTFPIPESKTGRAASLTGDLVYDGDGKGHKTWAWPEEKK